MAHAMLVAAYHLLARKPPTKSQGPTTTSIAMGSEFAIAPFSSWSARGIA